MWEGLEAEMTVELVLPVNDVSNDDLFTACWVVAEPL